ncbi:MAG: DUF4097 family beta strand repeat-containing protein [Bacillota bacterium]
MKTFLENLKKELTKQNINKETITEIINDHEEMIQSALDEGLDEDKITQKFGDPEKIAKELKEIEPEKKKYNNSYELIQAFNSENINKIKVKLVSEDLKLEVADINQIEVYGKSVKANKYDIEIDSDCLNLTRKNDITFGLLNFTSKSGNFIIKLPRTKEFKNIQYKGTSGDIDIKEIISEEYDIKNTSGDIDIKQIQTNIFNIKNISGDIEITKSNIYNLTISVVSGDIDIETTTIAQNLKINSVSGDTEIENSSTKELLYNSVSGDFKGKEYYPENVIFKSITGDIL